MITIRLATPQDAAPMLAGLAPHVPGAGLPLL